MGVCIFGTPINCNVIRHMLQKQIKKERYSDTISFNQKTKYQKEYLSWQV